MEKRVFHPSSSATRDISRSMSATCSPAKKHSQSRREYFAPEKSSKNQLDSPKLLHVSSSLFCPVVIPPVVDEAATCFTGTPFLEDLLEEAGAMEWPEETLLPASGESTERSRLVAAMIRTFF